MKRLQTLLSRGAIALILLVCTSTTIRAQTTVFTENMGIPIANTLIGAYAGGTAPATFQNKGFLKYTGTAEVRSSVPSNYAGASGGGNVFITNTSGRSFQIDSIITTGLAHLVLTFGVLKSTTNMSELKLEFSTDGVIYTNVPFPLQSRTDPAGWYLVSNLALPAGAENAAKLKLRWTQTASTTQFRIDDVGLIAGIIPVATTDWFRSTQSANWNVTSTWEESPDNATWYPSTFVPTGTAQGIDIQSGHTVIINDVSQTMNNVTVNGTLLFTGGTSVFAMPTNGVMNINNGGLMKFSTSSAYASVVNLGSGSKVTINTGGIISINISGGSNMYTFASDNTGAYVWNTSSIFEWNPVSNLFAFATTGVTYFPNVNTSTIPIFRITKGQTVGSNSPTKIFGLLEVNDNTIWQNDGATNFRNGVIGTALLNFTGSTPTITIGDATGSVATTAKIGGTGVITKNGTAMGVTITNNCTTTLVSSKTINSVSLTVAPSAILDASTFQLTGSANTLTVNGTVKTANINGFSGTASTTVASTAFTTTTLNSGSTVEYYSSSAQVFSGRSDYYNATISGGNVKTMNGNVIIGGTLTSTLGDLSINGNTLTINGSYARTSGLLVGSTTSNLVVGSSNGTVNLYFAHGGFNNYLKDVTVNAGILGIQDTLNIVGGSSFGTVTLNGVPPSQFAVLNVNAPLVFKSDANGTARMGTCTAPFGYNGDAIIERFIPARRAWRLLCPSLKRSSNNQKIREAWQENATNSSVYTLIDPNPGYGMQITYRDSADVVNGYDANLQRNPSLQVWSNNAWAVPSGTAAVKITDYSGYMAFVRGNRANLIKLQTAAPTSTTTLRTKGIINVGDVTDVLPALSGQYALVGNPYVSSIYVPSVLTSSSSSVNANTFSIWDPGVGLYGAYITKVGGVSSLLTTNYPTDASSDTVQSGQGFFVTATVNNPSVVFHETDKVVRNSSSVFARPSHPGPPPLVRIQLRNDTALLDGVAVAFADSAMGLDMGSSSENISLQSNNKMLAVQIQPLHKVDTFRFEFLKLAQHTYHLRITQDMQDLGADFELVDSFLHIHMDLKGHTDGYAFTVTADTASYKHRFMLIAKAKHIHVPPPHHHHDKDVHVYPNPTAGKLYISVADKPYSGSVRMTDVYGRTVIKETWISNGVLNCSSIAPGLYFVKVGDSTTINVIKQ